MRCPKCHYLSFDPEPRCKNCGYGFSLDEPDLLIRDAEASDDEPLLDVTFRGGNQDVFGAASATAVLAPVESVVAKPVVPGPTAVERAPMVRERAHNAPKPEALRPDPPKPAPTTELPLFVKALTAAEPRETETIPEEPLVRVPSEPRAPLAVRRKAAEPAAPKPRPAAATRKLGPLDRDLLEDLRRIEKLERKEAAAEARAASVPADQAGAAKRLAAAGLDAVLMGGLGVIVLWVTLRWCELPIERVTVLPAVPTLAFLLIVGLGYLLMFTAAGGQTIGKMVLGIRVVGDLDAPDVPRGLTFKQAFYRELLTLPSVIVLGAGFIPALIGEERALHDRLAHTRVVRA